MLKSFAVCSVGTNNYLADAVAFSRSLNRSNPGIPFILFSLGHVSASTLSRVCELCPNLTVVKLESILDPVSLAHYIKLYTPFEASCALRGVCHRYINDSGLYNSWLMLDLDISVAASLDQIVDLICEHRIFLTAHCSIPVSLADAIPYEKNLLINGLYNGGVLGFSRSPEASLAISWLASRLEHYSESSRARLSSSIESRYDFLFVDQLWLNLIPLYFPCVYISNDPCHNLGHWNLWQGSLRFCTAKNRFIFDDRDVVIMHFSGLPESSPEFVSLYSNLYSDRPSAAWAAAARIFLDEVNWAKGLFPASSYTYANQSPQRIVPPSHKRLGIKLFLSIKRYLKALIKAR